MSITAARPKITQPYRRARLGRREGTITEVSRALLASDVITVVEFEGPIHIDLVYQRFTEAWGIGRLGNRIRESIDSAVGTARFARKIEQRGDFLWPIALKTPPVRLSEPSDARKIEHIPPEELVEAVYVCVAEARSLSTLDLVRQAARLFGISRIGASVEAGIHQAIATAHSAKRIVVSGDTVRLV